MIFRFFERILSSGNIGTDVRQSVRRIHTTVLPIGQIPQTDHATQLPILQHRQAAHLMGRQQVRRLPVMENGKLCGMVSLGDLANREDSCMDAADALTDICSNISTR